MPCGMQIGMYDFGDPQILAVNRSPALARVPRALAKRVALFIGNQAYPHERVLTNPVNDVDLLGKLFKDELKFDSVVLRTNLKADDIDREVIAFAKQAQGADAAVFYYSGHGMKSPHRHNYLLPVDFEIDVADDITIKRKVVSAEEVRDRLKVAGATVTLVLLDACRDGPGSGKSGSKGLARMECGKGLLIGYATNEDRVADDGNNGNSPYALGLAQAFRQTNKPILVQLDEASDVVKRLTDRASALTLSASSGTWAHHKRSSIGNYNPTRSRT